MDFDVVGGEVDEVPGVGLRAGAGGDSGAGVGDDGGVMGQGVPEGGGERNAAVEVAGEEEIYACRGEGAHGGGGAGDEGVFEVCGGDVHGVMGDDDADGPGCRLGELRYGVRDLPGIDAAVLGGEEADGVDAREGDFAVIEEGCEIGGDVALVVIQRAEGATEEVSG